MSSERQQAQKLRCTSRFKELLALPILLVVAVIYVLIHPLIHWKNVEYGFKTGTIRELHRERQTFEISRQIANHQMVSARLEDDLIVGRNGYSV